MKLRRELGVFQIDSAIIDRIANRRKGGKRASNTASFTHISHCDTIETQILNWRQSSEFANMRLCGMINPAKIPRVYVRSG